MPTVNTLTTALIIGNMVMSAIYGFRGKHAQAACCLCWAILMRLPLPPAWGIL